MKIVHVITRLMRAGSEENTLLSCVHQAECGHEVYVVYGRDHICEIYETQYPMLRFIGIDAMVHPIRPKSDFLAYNVLRRLFLELEPDIVHTHQSKAGILGRAAARAAKVPGVVHTVHIAPFLNVSPLIKPIYVVAERAGAALCDVMIDVSEGMRDACLAHGVGHRDQHRVIHSGINLKRFQTASPPNGWRQEVDRAEGPPPRIILMLAALETRKRHSAFLAAVAPLLRQRNDIVVAFAGEGEEHSAIEAEILRLGMSGKVRLLGYHPAPEQWLALADLTVLTSSREGLPRVVMQSLAAGKPVVTTYLPGIKEVIADGVNGLVLAQDDLDGVAAAVVALMDDPVRLAALSRGAVETDLSRWTVEAMCMGIDSAYDQAMKQGVERVSGRFQPRETCC